MNDEPPKGRLLYRIEIDAPPDEVWNAITDPEWTRRFFHDTAVHSTWAIGAPISYDLPDGRAAIAGAILEYEAPRRFVMSARFLFDEDSIAEPESRVTWEVSANATNGTVLTLLHDRVPPHTLTLIQGGWSGILADLHRVLRPGSEPQVEAS